MKTHIQRNAGFSLIEVAIALMVLSIGIVAAIGLMPGGLENSKKATDDTQVSLFADSVLNTVRSIASDRTTTWASIANGLEIEVVAPNIWDAYSTMKIKAGDTTPKEMVFRVAQDKTIEEMTLSCTLNLEKNPSGYPAQTVRATLNISPVPAVAFANTNVIKQTYYAIIHRGDLP